NPRPVATAAVTTVTSAARRSRRSRKYNTNAAGVSFTAAAIPTSSPRGQRVRDARQSTATSAISTRLTWPNLNVSSTGSSSSASGSAADATDNAPGRPASGQTRRATRYSVTATLHSDAAYSATQAAVHGSTWSGSSTIAAK